VLERDDGSGLANRIDGSGEHQRLSTFYIDLMTPAASPREGVVDALHFHAELLALHLTGYSVH